MTDVEAMDGTVELVNPSESDRWTAIRFSDGDFSMCGHVHRSLDGATECAKAWQRASPPGFRFGVHGLTFAGSDAKEMAARLHSSVADCGCPKCVIPGPLPANLQLVVSEEGTSGVRMLALKGDVASALDNWAEWHELLAQAIGACDSLFRQGAPGPYRVYLCDDQGRILGTARTGNPKLYDHEPGRPGLEDGFFTGQRAWDEFGATVRGWLAHNGSLGELALPA